MSVLAAAYYLNPEHFKEYNDSEKDILANALKRLTYLSGKEVKKKELREALDFDASKDIMEELFSKQDSYFDIGFNGQWRIAKMGIGSNNYYTLNADFSEETLGLHADHIYYNHESNIRGLLNISIRKLSGPEKDEDQVVFGF